MDSISPETVRQTVKKNGMTKRKIEYWVIPPDADGEFVAQHGGGAGDLRKKPTIPNARWCAWTSSPYN